LKIISWLKTGIDFENRSKKTDIKTRKFCFI
jgi:hypothetical protein